ncbi:protein brown [Uranotaenia lowii]|uniref:protein brown n=1 Tax=Uranotaenia lowii TaxID=190385 RepID=UPI00247907D8|nr:protein brown [Uranotaenia lowii]
MAIEVVQMSVPRAESAVLLEWKYLSVQISSGERKTWKFWTKNDSEPSYILQNASGAIRSGNLVAVMGASGSGKTTFLAALSMRMAAEVQGEVLINGLPVSQAQMKRLSGFVPQFDIALDALTVREHLTFVSKLKGIPMSRTNDVIGELGMDKFINTRISNLSGGERKKVNLAGELLTEPDILFCDEPTTGLDSFSALSVLRTLQNLATNGRKAVICTIHHPASDIFQCFTDIVLVRSGRMYFQGPTNEAEQFFSKINFPLPENCNPADHYFKLVCEHTSPEEEESAPRSSSSITRHRKRDEMVSKCHVENIRQKYAAGSYLKSDVIEKLRRSTNHACWLSQLTILLHRGILDSIRNFREYIIVTLLFLITSVTLSSVYYPIKPTSQTAIQDIRGALFVMVCELVYTISYAVFYVFPQEIPLLRREVGERMYRLSAYYTHKALLTVPKAFFESFLFIGIIYGSVQFTSGFWTYVGMSMVGAVASILAVAHGFLLTCMTGSMEMSIEYGNIIFQLFALWAGQYLNIRAFPLLKYLSFFFFATEGISIYYWEDIGQINCRLRTGEHDTRSTNNATRSCLRDGQAVLRDYGYGTSLDVVQFNYWIMAAEILIIHVMCYFFLRRLIRKVGFY